ncbi:MAG: RNA-directed DNA polymerase, partial [Methylococcaceae bacterium]
MKEAHVNPSQVVLEMNNVIRQAIDNNSKLKKQKPKTNPWWTPLLSKLRKRVNRLRRKMQRTKNRTLKDSFRIEYKTIQQEYKRSIDSAKTDSWKRFCDRDSGNVFGSFLRTLKRNSQQLILQTLSDGSGNFSSSVDEMATAILNHFFPEKEKNSQDQNNIIHTNNQPELFPAIKEHEIKEIISNINIRKSTGPDQLNGTIVKQLFQHFPTFYVHLFNLCLEKGIFPAPWKQATLKIIPKNYSRTDISAYRPICLLPILGKVFEKIITNRILHYLYNNNFINDNQHGFLKQKSTITALSKINNFLRSSLEQKYYAVTVSIDIKGAFDSVQWDAIIASLSNKKVPTYLLEIMKNYFKDRKVTYNICNRKFTRNPAQGCPQGSVVGPLAWNLVCDLLLAEFVPKKDSQITVFADDITIQARANNPEEVGRAINDMLLIVSKWARDNQLAFSLHKCCAMCTTKKLTYTNPDIILNNTPLPYTNSIKLLGVIIDSKLNFNKHIKDKTNKALQLAQKLMRYSRQRWGPTKGALSLIYNQVVVPAITYGCEIWGDKAQLAYNKKLLFEAERNFGLRMIRGYRTTSRVS